MSVNTPTAANTAAGRSASGAAKSRRSGIALGGHSEAAQDLVIELSRLVGVEVCQDKQAKHECLSASDEGRATHID